MKQANPYLYYCGLNAAQVTSLINFHSRAIATISCARGYPLSDDETKDVTEHSRQIESLCLGLEYLETKRKEEFEKELKGLVEKITLTNRPV